MKGRSRAAAALAALGLVVGLAVTSCSGGGDVVLTVAPLASLLDEPANIRG